MANHMLGFKHMLFSSVNSLIANQIIFIQAQLQADHMQ